MSNTVEVTNAGCPIVAPQAASTAGMSVVQQGPRRDGCDVAAVDGAVPAAA